MTAGLLTALPAHGIGSREDLPLPLGWAVAGAAAAVVASFVLLGLLWREPRLDAATAGRPLPAGLARVLDAPAFRRVLAGLGLVAAAWTLLALVAGREDTRNPVPWVVYVLLWVGVVPVSVLLGPVWRQLNPVRALHGLLNRAAGLDPRAGVRPLPEGIGWWPAAAGLLAFAWLELVSPDPAALPTLRTAIALYATLHLFAAFVWGSRWFDRGDAFEAWSGLYGRISPLGRRADGVLVLRAPLVGLDAVRPAPGLVATVVAMLASTAFDGLAGSSTWARFVQGHGWSRQVAGTIGLLGTALVLGVVFLACCAGAGRVGGIGAREAAGLFAPSVVPVALGYVVAHYWSLLAVEGQRAFVRLSDPLGTGADWLGTGHLQVSYALATPAIVANVQVLAIVVGHVLGVVVAHDRAVRLFPRARAVVGQLPLLVLMVALTCFGLFLLFWD
ncbi:MAG TPA: hypothetical protein VE781_00625 [Kineosporiaceae bacterium]|nr:hypothetical protein [Kineosporiaceae bacterium]